MCVNFVCACPHPSPRKSLPYHLSLGWWCWGKLPSTCPCLTCWWKQPQLSLIQVTCNSWCNSGKSFHLLQGSWRRGGQNYSNAGSKQNNRSNLFLLAAFTRVNMAHSLLNLKILTLHVGTLKTQTENFGSKTLTSQSSTSISMQKIFFYNFLWKMF